MITIQEFIVWLIIGAIAGSLVGALVTFRKKGFGDLKNLGLGMAGAVIGGLIFKVLKIDLGLGTITIKLNNLVAAFVGSVILLVIISLLRYMKKSRR